MGLEDLQALQEDLIAAEAEEVVEQTETKKDYSVFDNYSKKRISLIGYLIGVKEELLHNPPFNQEYIEKLRDKRELNVIRALCSLRLSFMYNYDKIYKERSTKGPFALFEDMKEWIDITSLNYLKSQGIEALQTGVDIKEFTKHIANINQLIEENIDAIHQYVPEWIEWKYIREIFIMPNCAAGHNGCNYTNKKKGMQISTTIHNIRKDFFDHISFYPYQAYINWNPKKRDEDSGNILFNDCKFLRVLYDSHYETFKGEQYVIDAKNEIKNSIYDFIEQATNVALFVDCENIDPYKLASVFLNLDEEKVSKIKKIVLYDDIHTTNAWDILEEIIDIDVEHEVVERIKDDKSLVDHALSIGVTKAVYADDVESVVIVSSDSDFWSLIKYLPQVKFFVMNETNQTSGAVINKLDDFKIPHCYMDDFAQDAIQPYKNRVLKRNLQSFIDNFNENGVFEIMNIEELLDNIFQRAGIDVPYKQLEKEKEDFYNKYIKKLRLLIDDTDDGRRFRLIIGQ